MRIMIASAVTLLAGGCVTATEIGSAFGDRNCTAPSVYEDYKLGADAADNANARRQANLECGLSGSARQHARDRSLANMRNTPEEQALIDRAIARSIRSQR